MFAVEMMLARGLSAAGPWNFPNSLCCYVCPLHQSTENHEHIATREFARAFLPRELLVICQHEKLEKDPQISSMCNAVVKGPKPTSSDEKK